MSEVTVMMPLQLTPEMIRAVRYDESTSCGSLEEWHVRLGWLICAWDVLVAVRQAPAAPQGVPEHE